MPPANQLRAGLTDTWGRNNRRLADRLCAECGGSFRPLRSSSAYCSRLCARQKNGGQNIKLETWWVNKRGYEEGRVLTAQGHRRVKRHRFVMECHIGRKLSPREDVHHINGDKLDNRIDNLELLDHGAHSRVTNSERQYRRGYTLSLTVEERAARRARMLTARAAANKATGK